ncbi:dna polymerase delta subunit 3 [Fusarium heterosporum]|uniref:DNA polymerase delta subunit 3 n=1 Tax=Fusarium heterosporum TaxID=42747 RepID=A0A8H5WGJ7_FUSHE|nr:dna polymerase delta subunit 3 [Fusarium heterosporum]
MDEHKKFLADRLLSKERPITYRLLSRALDVHVNTAKEMLYDFHNYQNAQKANSIHATYLVYGTKTPDSQQSDGDVEMSSSMPEVSLSDEVPISTLTLAREEELKDILAAYQKVTSIHVYSLAPNPQKDLSLLSDVTTQLSEYSVGGDITAASKKYGIISNSNAQRRERKGRPQASASAPSKPTKKEPPASKSTSTATINIKQEAFAAKLETKQTKSAKQESSAPSSKEGTPVPNGGKKPTPSLKRGASGGIMQSFAKAAARPAKPKPAPKKEEDTDMALSDDGEADDSDIIATSSKPKPATDLVDIKRKRQEREDALRKMMEDDDDEDEKKESDKESEQDDEEMEEAPEPEPEPEAEAEAEAQKEEKEPAEMVTSTGDGRRRGKRRVMKKKRILDDQGYMVTIQEQGWESFSEDEAPAPAKKAAPTPTPSSSAGSKTKKSAPKGQGNIMSFFSKK